MNTLHIAKIMRRIIVHTILLLLTTLSFAQIAPTSKLEIRITGMRSTNGKISVNLFNKEDGFPDDPETSYAWKTVNIDPDTVVIVFEDLPYGEYAVSVLHDENSNGIMEKNFLGIPKEGFAFSNNYAPKIMSPSFSDAMFVLDQALMKAELKVLYF
jgi:uncharacterized protein (DUF2141 family)